MTTEQMIEDFIELGTKAYKKNCRNSLEARRLNRHEPIVVDGYEFCCWREYSTYKMAECIQMILPNVDVRCELSGNNSTIILELTDEEQKKLNNKLFVFLDRIYGGNYGK